MSVRLAKKDELDKVNLLRMQVNELHVKGRPDIFKPGFPDELRDFIYLIWDDPDKDVAVCERSGEILGFAVLHRIVKSETPFMYERVFLDIDELCVDVKHRRTGVGKELTAFIKEYAKEEGFDKIELNMWEFNSDALAFYEDEGFVTYRRYMELKL